jgi:hypothetical protein
MLQTEQLAGVCALRPPLLETSDAESSEFWKIQEEKTLVNTEKVVFFDHQLTANDPN